MFGIGLPEMILIMALALIVVGPDKLPELARSLAKGLMELKKTAEGIKESFREEGNPFDEVRPDLEEAARNLKNNLLTDNSMSQFAGEIKDEIDTVLNPEQNAVMAANQLQNSPHDAPSASAKPPAASSLQDGQATDDTSSNSASHSDSVKP